MTITDDFKRCVHQAVVAGLDGDYQAMLMARMLLSHALGELTYWQPVVPASVHSGAVSLPAKMADVLP